MIYYAKFIVAINDEKHLINNIKYDMLCEIYYNNK